MSLSSTRTALVRVLCIAFAAAITFGLASSVSYAQQEERARLFTTPPENPEWVWAFQALHVAWELEADEAAPKLVMGYISARQKHSEKIKALPRTRESWQQFQEITTEARSSLEKSLVELLGEEKGKKAAELLGGFSFFSDHMTADVLTTQRKAFASLSEYQRGVDKAFKEARESGSFEGMREKFTALLTQLGEKLSAIFSQQQLDEWKEKYGWLLEEPASP